MPIRPGERRTAPPGGSSGGSMRRTRVARAGTWRRRQVMDGRTGALDMPGETWRDRPAIDRGDGVFLAGDMVAAPGCLSEIAWGSAVEASRLAVARPAERRADAAERSRPR